MSRVIAFAEVTCDDCGKSLRRLAPPHTKATPMNERRTLRQLGKYATRRRWQMEGPSLMAGDLCPRCARVADHGHDTGLESA